MATWKAEAMGVAYLAWLVKRGDAFTDTVIVRRVGRLPAVEVLRFRVFDCGPECLRGPDPRRLRVLVRAPEDARALVDRLLAHGWAEVIQ